VRPVIEPGHDLGLGGEGTWNFPALAVTGAVAQAVSLASTATSREQRQTEAPVQGPHCTARHQLLRNAVTCQA
jgi:hypothetical protein